MTISVYAINTDYRNLMTKKEGFTRHIVVEVEQTMSKSAKHEINSRAECENLIMMLQSLSLKCWE